MRHHYAMGALLALTLAAAAPAADILPRQPLLGITATPVLQGLRVDTVASNAMAAKLGLKPGDTITAMEGKPIDAHRSFVDTFTAVPAGKMLHVLVLRDGKTVPLSAIQSPRPDETYPNAVVKYGEVDVGSARMRDILTVPNGAGPPAIIFYVQGYSCTSIEATNPNGVFGSLTRALVGAGLAVYRVEKPGIGDSRGGTHCRDQALADEVATFRAAYLHLIGLGFPPDHIFILGHSLGGIEAPLIIAGAPPPRGVAAYGVSMKNWGDYIQDINTYQGFVTVGDDPVEAYKQGEADRSISQALFFSHQSPQQIVAAYPATGDRLKEMFAWDGGSQMYGRSWHVLQDLAVVDFPEAWARAQTNVLSLYGAVDEIALTSEDQRRIADIVNYYRPGTARFQEVPDTMHGMDLVGDRDAFRERNVAAGGIIVPGHFNPAVADALVAWVRDCLAKPPVRTMTFPNSLAERVRKMKAIQSNNPA